MRHLFFIFCVFTVLVTSSGNVSDNKHAVKEKPETIGAINIVKEDGVHKSRVQKTIISKRFIDYNNNLEIYYSDSLLLCRTTNGIKYYSPQKDEWIVKKTQKSLQSINRSKYYNYSIPNWYPRSNYTSVMDVKGSFLMIGHGDEAGHPIKTEIVDTVTRKAYVLLEDNYNSFCINDIDLWISTSEAVSHINRITNKRTDYLMFPAFKELVGVHRYDNEIYYLDSHYGIFKYRCDSKRIEGIREFHKETHFEYVKISGSIIVDSVIYALSYETDLMGLSSYKARLIIYNIKSKEIKEIETNLRYLDTFLKAENRLFIYGDFYELDEGFSDNYGGLCVYDIENDSFIKLVDAPVVSVGVTSDSINAIAIKKNEEQVIKVNNYAFDKKLTLINHSLERYCNPYYNEERDTVIFEGEPYLNDRKKSSVYYNITHERVKDKFVDTVMYKQEVVLSSYKIERDNVEEIKY